MAQPPYEIDPGAWLPGQEAPRPPVHRTQRGPGSTSQPPTGAGASPARARLDRSRPATPTTSASRPWTGAARRRGRGLIAYACLIAIVAGVGALSLAAAKRLAGELGERRLVASLAAANGAEEEVALACRILLANPAEPESREALLRRTLAPGTEGRLDPLAPLFEPGAGGDPGRVATTSAASTLRLLEARYRFGRGEHARAAALLRAEQRERALHVLDATRLVVALARSGEAPAALGVLVEIERERPEARLDLLRALAETRHPLLRHAAAEQALAARAADDGGRAAAAVIEAVAPADPDLALALAATTLAAVGGPLEPVRARLAGEVLPRAATALRALEAGWEGRRRLVQADVAAALPFGDPWGRAPALRGARGTRALVSFGANGRPGGEGAAADIEAAIDLAPTEPTEPAGEPAAALGADGGEAPGAAETPPGR